MLLHVCLLCHSCLLDRELVKSEIVLWYTSDVFYALLKVIFYCLAWVKIVSLSYLQYPDENTVHSLCSFSHFQYFPGKTSFLPSHLLRFRIVRALRSRSLRDLCSFLLDTMRHNKRLLCGLSLPKIL